MKVYAYARVSTSNQKEEGTINVQIDALKEYCKNNFIDLVKVFKDDGVSGGLEDRPALSALFDELENKKEPVDIVLVWKLDRLARDLYVQEHLIKKLEALNVRLVSTKERDLDSSDPMRKAFRQFMGVISELEKAFITMRLKEGRKRKASKGKYSGGAVPLGYCIKNKDLAINGERELIKKIFNLKRSGRYSINAIARKLNEDSYETKRGGKWHASTISYILKNPVYKGKYSYKEIKTTRNDLRLS